MSDPTGPPGDPSKYAKSYQEGYDASYRDFREIHGDPKRFPDPDDEKDKRKDRMKKKLDLENRRSKKALDQGYEDGWSDAGSDTGYPPG